MDKTEHADPLKRRIFFNLHPGLRASNHDNTADVDPSNIRMKNIFFQGVYRKATNDV